MPNPLTIHILAVAPVSDLEFRRALQGAGSDEAAAALERAAGRARRRKLRAALRRMANIHATRVIFSALTQASTAGSAS